MDQLIRPRRIPREVQEQIRQAIRDLPVLAKGGFDEHEMCAICLMPFSSIPSEGNQTGDNLNQQNEAQSIPQEQLEDTVYGVTKLDYCGHTFCKRDLTEWINGLHGSCPTCRHPFLELHLPSETDDESSDGGEYIPNEDFEEEDETFDFTDGFSEADGPEAEISLEDYLQGVSRQEAMEQEDEEEEFERLAQLASQVDEDMQATLRQEAIEEEIESLVQQRPSEVDEDDVYFEPNFDSEQHWQADVSDIEDDIRVSFMEIPVAGSAQQEVNEDMTLLACAMDSDDEMDEDYVPMDEDEFDSDSDSEPSFGFTDGESEDVSSDFDLSLEDMCPEMPADFEDKVSVHEMDDADLPGNEKALSSNAGLPNGFNRPSNCNI
ncbi:hypothetical protein FA15DRAFT_691563 [Coprinopsis marcescibilis]|uniref:RING-type domain-containing protein n=1 Tax=Coprinopsis marcescibilis TaxID=230819 RepID=A0A5C3L704_COPMA|nr:hypothetical protein FA15DRAFT_691563 [Coprinopsis marcescibilis]